MRILFLLIAVFGSAMAWGGFRLHDAAHNGDLQAVREIVEEHRQVDVRNTRFQTALHIAVGKGQTEVVLYLLSMGADPNAIGSNRWTSLHYASLQEKPEILQALLEKGGDLQRGDHKGITPFHYACYFKNSIMVDEMIKANVDVNTEISQSGLTPLHIAAAGGSPEIVRRLVDANAKIDIRDAKGRTPKEVALEKGQFDVVSSLDPYNIIDTNSFKNDLKQFHHAATVGDVVKVAQFLTSGMSVDVVNDEGSTALHIAAEKGRSAVVRLLLDHGADPNKQNKDGKWTSLFFAVWEGHVDIFKMLVAKGAQIEHVDAFYLSAVHYGAVKGKTAIVEYALNIKPELIHGRDYSDWTLLHYAAMNNEIEVARLLLDRGADLNAKSNNGETPIDFAREQGFQQMVNFLLERN